MLTTTITSKGASEADSWELGGAVVSMVVDLVVVVQRLWYRSKHSGTVFNMDRVLKKIIEKICYPV